MLATALALLLATSPATAGRGEDVRYPSGDLTLAAELLLPDARGPVPAAVIVQGSGDSDRSNGWARQMAEALVRNGVAVLLTDKRGTGASGGDWRTAGFEELADDALAGVRYLRSRREVDSTRIGLAGLSQGGWIVPVAAARDARVAFVIDVSGTSVSFAEQSMLEMANTARQAGLSDAGVREVLAVNRAAARYLLTGDWDAYAQARGRAMETEARPVAEGFPGDPSLAIWAFLRKVAAFDPMAYWVVVNQPVFVAYGAEDEKDNVPVAESVRRLEHGFASVGKTDYRIQVVPGVGHALWQPGTHELAPAFTSSLADWLRTHVTGG